MSAAHPPADEEDVVHHPDGHHSDGHQSDGLGADDRELEADYGFEPAVRVTGNEDSAVADERAPESAAHGAAASAPEARRSRPSVLRRRVGAAAALLVGLVSIGGTYAAFASSSSASDTTTSAQDISAGRQIYQVTCISCHGVNLEGQKGQGPSLIGVGGAATYLQVSTGRMPVAGQGASIGRKEAKFDEKQTEQLSAYVEAVGGGPAVPVGSVRGSSDTIAQGGALFRLNCASCHGTTFKGAPLSAGKVAPSLNPSTDKQIYTAMLSGPESMPIFSDNQLTPDQKRSIIAYIQTVKASNDPGGSGIDRIGPVSEAIVIWVGGVGLLMIAILWIGAKSR